MDLLSFNYLLGWWLFSLRYIVKEKLIYVGELAFIKKIFLCNPVIFGDLGNFYLTSLNHLDEGF